MFIPPVQPGSNEEWLSYVCVCVFYMCVRIHAAAIQCTRHVWLLAAPWTAAHQAPLSVGFLRQGYWSGVPFPSPGGLPDPGTESTSLHWQANSVPPSHQGSPANTNIYVLESGGILQETLKTKTQLFFKNFQFIKICLSKIIDTYSRI